MNSVGKEFKQLLPKLSANMALALVFIAIGSLSSVILASVTESFGFYSWLVLTLVGGVFSVRALSNILPISDRTVGLIMTRLDNQQLLSMRMMAKDLIWIIVTILATAATFPVLETIGSVGLVLQSVTAIVAIGAIFLFVYDITRIIHQIIHDKASTVVNWFVHKQVKEMRARKTEIIGGENL